MPGRRLTEKFRKENRESGFAYVAGGRLPPRRISTPLSSEAPPTPLSPTHPSSPQRNPTSPPRKIIGDFKAFGGGSGGASVFGAPLLKSSLGPGGGMFGVPVVANGGMRDNGNSRGGFDEEDEEDGSTFKKDNISLDQVSSSLIHDSFH